MESIPNEILMEILAKLSLSDVYHFCSTNKEINRLCHDYYLSPRFWKLKLHNDYPDIIIPPWIHKNKEYKKLYMYWLNYKSGHSKLIEIPAKIFNHGNEEVGFSIDDEIRTINKMNKNEKLFQYVEDLNIRRGDVVHLSIVVNYRNEGKYMYTGHDFKMLNYSKDEYGSVPEEFQVIDEFSIDYWIDTIAHNYIVNFNIQPYLSEAITNLKRLESEDFTIYKTTFTHWSGLEYTIILTYDENKTLLEVQEDLNTSTFGARDEYEIYDGPYDPERTLFNSPFSKNNLIYYTINDDEAEIDEI